MEQSKNFIFPNQYFENLESDLFSTVIYHHAEDTTDKVKVFYNSDVTEC